MHSWFQYCIDPDVYDKCRTLKDFIAVLRKQSNTDEALIPYRESVRFDDYDEDGDFIGKLKAPRYFGAGFEAFSEVFLNVFDNDYNLTEVHSQDGVDIDIEDTGYDITAVTAKDKLYRGTINKKATTGSPVYIQVKGTFNPTKEFMTNDGSRIMNFYANSQGHARMVGKAYQARYILITSAKGLHWKLEKNTQKDIEVINFTHITKRVKENPLFWNQFRAGLGLKELPFSSRWDPEFESVMQEVKEIKELELDSQ